MREIKQYIKILTVKLNGKRLIMNLIWYVRYSSLLTLNLHGNSGKIKTNLRETESKLE
jgi:hypothetical protein